MSQEEIQKQYREQQTKYVYYLIALAVAAIGFSVDKTMGEPLHWRHIPIGLAVLCWGLSVYAGLKFLGNLMGALFLNNELFEVEAGRNEISGDVAWKKEVGRETLTQLIKDKSKSSEFYGSSQLPLFLSGIACFLAWHILAMFLSSNI